MVNRDPLVSASDRITRGSRVLRALALPCALVLALVTALTFVSCGGSSARVAAPLPPSGAQGAWLVAALGSSPDVSIALRSTAARTDPYWGPLVGRVLAQRDRPGEIISHGSGAMVLNARQVDLHIVFRDPIALERKDRKMDVRAIGWLGVISGAVPFDPLAVRDSDGRPLFVPPFRMPSGVLVFFANPSYVNSYGAIAPTAFLLPNGTYVVTDQVSAPHVQGLLTQNASPPLAMELPPDSLGGITFGVTSLRFVDAKATDKTAITQGMTAAGFGLRGGAGGAVDGYASYASNDDAQRGYEALERACAHKPDSCMMSPGTFRDAKASRDGNRIVVSLAFTERFLNAIQSQDFK